MGVKRREFLKLTGLISLGGFLPSVKEAMAASIPLHKKMAESPTICPYCAVGCGQIVSKSGNKLLDIEGDPDHPINRGALCPKGAGSRHLADNTRRITEPLYRAPGSDHWEKKSWDWMLDRLAKRIKKTRDETFIRFDKDGYEVNRAEGLAYLGGAAHNNEECYAAVKFARALGVPWLEHQARICHSSTVAALGNSFGRGAMTNHVIDMKNSDMFLIMGSNAAENHPLTFKWITEAVEKRGAKIISVDPRFTRTSSKAHYFAQIRAGTDIAFLGGMIKYIIENKKYDEFYVKNYTNAALLINPDFKDTSELDGVFSGYNPKKRAYDKSTWQYQTDETGIPLRDETLSDPNCVFQIMKRHYARYSIETVSEVTGISVDKLKTVYELYSSTGQKGSSGTILYAMGATQHTYGTQHIRGYAVIQLLLGNIGVAGGGVNALRGHGNVQGSTDHGLLFHDLPGYIGLPKREERTLDARIKDKTPENHDPKSLNWWKNYGKYLTSQLVAWWRNIDPKTSYHYLPKLGPHKNGIPDDGSNYSHIAMFEAMYQNVIKGFLVMGENPAVSASNAGPAREAMDNLDWLAVLEIFDTETASFWNRPGADPKKIKTEVFLLPNTVWVEKNGSFTNTGRWAQWKNKITDGPGNVRDELWVYTELVKRLKKLYSEGGSYPDPVLNLSWWNVATEQLPEEIAKEINGFDIRTGKLVSSFTKLKDDGSTACGNWLYAGSWTEKGNMMARRDDVDHHPAKIGTYSNWAWNWPVNRRVLYNRASVDLNGQPLNSQKWVIKWNGSKWIGDVPDGGSPPNAIHPFIMLNEGYGREFAKGLADGPLPEHYEPYESPVKNPFGEAQINPACKIWATPGIDIHGDFDKYPVVLTTYRVTEHYLSGQMSRNVDWLAECQPNVFVEMDKEIAKKRGIRNGSLCEIVGARGKVKAVAIVTDRIHPLKIMGKTVHPAGLLWSFGYKGLVTGDSANLLTPNIGDANTMIPEYKAFLGDLRKLEG